MDRNERDELVMVNLHLVRSIALNLQASLPAHVPVDDLIGAGQIGLMEAAARFDPAHGTTFHSFAKFRIRGAMLDSLRALDWASRDARRYVKAVEELRAQHPDDWQDRTAALAAEMGVSPERAKEILTLGPNVSIDVTIDREDGNMAREFPAPVETQADYEYARQELSNVLRKAMDENLPPRYQMVVELYYAGELTMREIGEMLGINESRVSQIHGNAIGKLRDAFAEAGTLRTDFAHV